MVLSARELAERRGAAGPPPATPSGPAPAVPAAPPRGREPEGPEAVLMHPDSTESSPINARIDVKLGARAASAYVENGRVETRDPELAAYLLRLGYRQMNTRLEVSEDPAWTAVKDRLRE